MGEGPGDGLPLSLLQCESKLIWHTQRKEDFVNGFVEDTSESRELFVTKIAV